MSQTTFNDLEALKVAIEIERRGERFYTLAADKFKEEDRDVSAMLEQLAHEEADHARVFGDLYERAFDLKKLMIPIYLSQFLHNNSIVSLIFQ